jgi:dTDP-4-dehydrorhamnose reductase
MSTAIKTVLVTGASGLLGRAIFKSFEENGWKAIGTGLSRSAPPRIRKLDVTDFDALEALVNETNPSVIVHRSCPIAH